MTSQGYSWSHHLKEEDDIFHEGFDHLKDNDLITITLENSRLRFELKEFSFVLDIPDHISQKYDLCFCAYLHQKEDRMSLQDVDFETV